ncbi:MAG: hypothetical protein RL404_596 [Pseudomonadota bacterium]|jgi:hypothetical protein
MIRHRRLGLFLAMLALLASFSVFAHAQQKKKDAPPEPPPPPIKPGTLDPLDCVVANFRAIGIDTQDAEARRSKAIAWLGKHGKSCTAEQLIVMRNNRQQWMGTADNATLAARIDGLLEVFAATNKDIAILLYGTPPAPKKPGGKDGPGGANGSAGASPKK